MDIFQLLKDDHALVKRELQQLVKDGQGRQIPIEQLRNIQQQLRVHMRMEEEYLYPAMRNIPEEQDLVKDAYEEHRQMRDIVENLSGNREQEDWQDQIQQLLDLLDHHVQEEERELFPTAQEKLSQDELNRLSEQMTQLKERELSRQRQ